MSFVRVLAGAGFTSWKIRVRHRLQVTRRDRVVARLAQRLTLASLTLSAAMSWNALLAVLLIAATVALVWSFLRPHK